MSQQRREREPLTDEQYYEQAKVWSGNPDLIADPAEVARARIADMDRQMAKMNANPHNTIGVAMAYYSHQLEAAVEDVPRLLKLVDDLRTPKVGDAVVVPGNLTGLIVPCPLGTVEGYDCFGYALVRLDRPAFDRENDDEIPVVVEHPDNLVKVKRA